MTSSGVDSFCMWHLLKDKYENPQPVYFCLGHKYQEIERETLAKLDIPIIKADFLKLGVFEKSDAYIPYRNLLLFCGAGLLGADKVLLGSLKGEYSRDKSNKFVRQSSNLLSFIDEQKIKLINPIGKYTKTQLVRKFLQVYPDKLELLKMTHSCYRNVRRCGRCMACFRRWVAFHNNEIEESYLNPPWEWEVIQHRNFSDWLRKFLKYPRFDLLVNNYEAYLALREQRR